MDSNHLRCIFCKDVKNKVLRIDQFTKEHFEKETYMCLVKYQDKKRPIS